MYTQKRKDDRKTPSDRAETALSDLINCYRRLAHGFDRQSYQTSGIGSQVCCIKLAAKYSKAASMVSGAQDLLLEASALLALPLDVDGAVAEIEQYERAARFERVVCRNTVDHASNEIHNTCNNRLDDEPISPKALRAGHLERK